MFGAWAFVAACGAFVDGVAYYEKKKNERKNNKNNNISQSQKSASEQLQTKVVVRREVSSTNNDAIKSLNREFHCGISCKKAVFFESPDYSTEYSVNEHKYIGYQTLQNEKVGTSEEKYGCDCDRISVYKDDYGNKVILLIHDIPCFDSGDREYDRYHLLYFFHNKGRIHALYCGEGYRIAKLILFENIKLSGMRLKQYLKSEGFPI